jgi:hypothetical protein
LTTTSHSVQLTVVMAAEDDIYKDLARVHRADRGDLPSGQIYRLCANGNRKRLIVRGLQGVDAPNGAHGYIYLDEATRDALGVALESRYQFQITKVGWFGRLCWAWDASDPAYNVAARLGVISFFLGVLSFFPVVAWCQAALGMLVGK